MSKEQLSKLNELSEVIIGDAIEVHRNLGPGLLESAYEVALQYELSMICGLSVQRQVPVKLFTKDSAWTWAIE